MRPGQNRRMRGRNRKGPNPLTRSYESNGPDVKVRGTAQHIAEKYSQLARDAQASGDPVAAENYFQHAEHYFRIIAAAQSQLQQTYGGFQRPYDDERDDLDAEEGNGFGYGPGQPAVHELGAPQPDVRGETFADDDGEARPERPRFERGPRGDRPMRQDRGDRPDRSDRQERGERQDRGERRERGPRPAYVNGNAAGEARRAESEEKAGLPAFLTTPVRTPIAPVEDDEASAPANEPAAVEEVAPKRTRRRKAPLATEQVAAESTPAEEDKPARASRRPRARKTADDKVPVGE
ncbi:DUF4167 domain-containing protein [Chelatococcus daeguensis]|nr:DUF4167 domain-containing protein [Chelatococcus daeguensis]